MEPSPKQFTIALAGNPNSGKTTIFNHITGTRQKVGNWPGVTVEKKEGRIRRNGTLLKIVDLPGIYSLTPFSIEEIVARDFLLKDKPDLVINIIDASNLERSLYLATQLREIDCKVVLALNMADVARGRGVRIEAEKLSTLLAAPVLFTIGNKNQGVAELLEKAIELAEGPGSVPPERKVKYSRDIEQAIDAVIPFLQPEPPVALPSNPRWTAIKLLENDALVKDAIQQRFGDRAAAILDRVEQQRRFIEDRYDEEPEIVLTDERYGFIAGIVKEVQTTSTRSGWTSPATSTWC
jgi:ferrous iron transport protein B